jgi:hypothetical protein
VALKTRLAVFCPGPLFGAGTGNLALFSQNHVHQKITRHNDPPFEFLGALNVGGVLYRCSKSMFEAATGNSLFLAAADDFEPCLANP